MTREAKAIPGHMKGRDWLMTQDWSDDEIELALDTADTLRTNSKMVFRPCIAAQVGVPDFL